MEFLNINLDNYDYKYKSSAIASYQLKKRDLSKLLVFKNKEIIDSKFNKLINYLPENTILFFNNTKVIKARIYLHNKSGYKIELLLLNQVKNKALIIENFKNNITYKCLIGNNKKWKVDEEIFIKRGDILIKIKKVDSNKVFFSWDKNILWEELLNLIGQMPIPPYLNRKTEKIDEKSYQTIYSKKKGSVAAPTAGLHFSKKTFVKIEKNNIKTDYFTLHVGLGTFKPILEKKNI